MGASAQNELLTAAETCRYLKVTPRTLYRYIQDRHMPAFKLGKEWRFVRSDLDQWLRSRSAAGHTQDS
jgi:excisionase family DNA binding protein